MNAMLHISTHFTRRRALILRLVSRLLETDVSMTGRTLRGYLEEFGVRWFWGKPGFYKTMCDLEDDGVVVGSYELASVGDESVRVRCYRLKSS